MATKTKRFILPEDEIPTQWYNIQADMINKPLPMLNPGTKKPLKAEDLYPIFNQACSQQELNQTDTWIDIPEEVYEQRKAKMKERVDAMIAYCTDHESCRSRILTAYFGEKGGCNCGICDVCTRKTATSLRHGELHDMMDFLLAEIDKGNDLPENLLRAWTGDRGKAEEALRYMIGEEMVSVVDGVLKRRG